MSHRLTKTIEATVPITAEEIAEIFINENSEFQVKFLNEVARQVDMWENPFAFQAQAIIDEKGLSLEARAIMGTMGEYGEIL